MQQIVKCHPSEIRAGDRINHAGAVVEVTRVTRGNFCLSWRFDIRYEATGGLSWVAYRNDGAGSTVARYQTSAN